MDHWICDRPDSGFTEAGVIPRINARIATDGRRRRNGHMRNEPAREDVAAGKSSRRSFGGARIVGRCLKCPKVGPTVKPLTQKSIDSDG